MPSRSARLVVATNASRIRAGAAAASAAGAASPSFCGTADGATGCQPPSAIGINWPPSQGTRLDPLRPACAICLASVVFACLRTAPLTGCGGVVRQSEAPRCDAADRLDMGVLETEHRRARQRQRVDMREVPIIGLA